MARDDVLVQYALNRPSLSFYAGRPNLASLLIHTNVNWRIVGQSVINDPALNNIWLDRNRRAFVLIRRGQSAITPLQGVINFLHEANDIIVLSNRLGNEPPDEQYW